MKKRLLLLLCFALIFSCSENNEEEEKKDKSKENIIDIIKDGYIDSIHFNKDVNVVYLEEFSFFENKEEGSYLVDMYFNGDDTLRNAKVFLCDQDIYDKAKYNWITDTSINITLYDSKGDSSFSFVARGMMDGSGSGMTILQ